MKWFCGKCGYDLRGMEGAACPECGGKKAVTRREMQVQRIARRYGAAVVVLSTLILAMTIAIEIIYYPSARTGGIGSPDAYWDTTHLLRMACFVLVPALIFGAIWCRKRLWLLAVQALLAGLLYGNLLFLKP